MPEPIDEIASEYARTKDPDTNTAGTVRDALKGVPLEQLYLAIHGNHQGTKRFYILPFAHAEISRRRELEETERQKKITKYASGLSSESARKASWRTFWFAMAALAVGALVNPFGGLTVSMLTPSGPPEQVEKTAAPTN
jgi:hypothetical protein